MGKTKQGRGREWPGEEKTLNFKYSDQGRFHWEGEFWTKHWKRWGRSPCMSGGRVIPGEPPTDAKCLRQQVARTLLSTDHVGKLEFPWDTETGLSAPQPQWVTQDRQGESLSVFPDLA